MTDHKDIDRYVKDPSLLIELCREVIEQLDSGDDDAEMDAMETQVREISRTIDRLEKSSVPVPDVLRAEKTRLAAALCDKTGTMALHHLAEEFEEILKDLRTGLGQDRASTARKRAPRKRSRSPKTDKKVLREQIIRALKKIGGRARVADVIEEMSRHLKGKLLPGDLELRQDGKTSDWVKNACWERLRMVREGILRDDSPNGIWELTEDHQ